MLEEIKKSIANENISYSEILWLQNHKKEVLEDGDITLCEWAGISEDEYERSQVSICSAMRYAKSEEKRSEVAKKIEKRLEDD